MALTGEPLTSLKFSDVVKSWHYSCVPVVHSKEEDARLQAIRMTMQSYLDNIIGSFAVPSSLLQERGEV